LLSNYNIKYICTIYTRLNTCLTSIPRFALRVKLTLRLLKILFQGVDVVEWSRALDVRLIEWYCSASMVWVQIPSKEEQILIALKSNSNTVWFNLQTYMIFSFNLVSFVTLRSSATYILYGCHLLLDVCIIYFISFDCIMNSSLSYTIYQTLLS
jgi:hypothetical protein